MVTGRHLHGAALVVYCQGMESHQLECHCYQKSCRLDIYIQVCDVSLWYLWCMVLMDLGQKMHSGHWTHDDLGGSSEWSGYVEVLTTAFIGFIF